MTIDRDESALKVIQWTSDGRVRKVTPNGLTVKLSSVEIEELITALRSNS